MKFFPLAILATFFAAQFVQAGDCRIKIKSTFDCTNAGFNGPCAITIGSHKEFHSPNLSFQDCLANAFRGRVEFSALNPDIHGVKSVLKYKGEEGTISATIKK